MEQSKVPKLTSRAVEEPKFDSPRKSEANPIELQLNRNPGSAQVTKPNPPPVVRSQVGGQFNKKVDEVVPRQDNATLRTNDSHQRYGARGGGTNSADSHSRPHAIRSAGASVEQSPLHHRTGPRGSSSQPSSSDSLQGASGRPRTRPSGRPTSNQPTVGGPMVPEFGSWNKNPEQAEGYTDVFNQVLSDKKTPGRNTASTPHNPLRTPKQTKGCFSRLFGCFSSKG